jgi:hypothetical protein
LILENHTSQRQVIALTVRVTAPTFRATPLRVRVISKPANYNVKTWKENLAAELCLSSRCWLAGAVDASVKATWNKRGYSIAPNKVTILHLFCPK